MRKSIIYFRSLRIKLTLLFAILMFISGLTQRVTAQSPTVTVRCSNPTFDCNIYCVDVEFVADTSGYQFGAMNIRFFYPDDLLEFYDFMQIEENYLGGEITVETSLNAGPALFNFSGGADFVNGTIFVDDPEMAVYLDTVIWTKLFQICFIVDDANSNMESFCPSIVWDLEQDPEDGGFLPGDDGVVILLVDPDDNSEAIPCNENVVQFNWEYIGNGSPPYGEPVQDSCIIFDCPLTIFCANDTTVECQSSIDPSATGYTISADFCPGDSTIVYTDSIGDGSCLNDYTIYRKWVATNLCGNADSCLQIINVIDTTGPSMSCPSNITVDCADDVPIIDLADVMMVDNCPGTITIAFEGEVISNQTCTDRYLITRTFSATDECGNSSTCTQTITVFDDEGPLIFCPPNITVQCAGLVPAPDIETVISSDFCGGLTTQYFVSDVISNQVCANNYIITRTYSATDECGNSSTCTQVISVVDNVPPTISTCPVTRNLEGCSVSVITDPPYAMESSGSSEAEFENATNLGNTSDFCGIASVSYIDVAAGSCPITVTRTWTVSDACGQTATCIQTIYIHDLTVPVIAVCAIDRMIDDCDLASITEPPYSVLSATSSEAEFEGATNQGLVSDDCAITDVTYIDVAMGFCPIVVTRTWTLSDACGNSATCNQTITICMDPSDADAGPDQELCNLVSTTLAGNTPLIGNGIWSMISGTASITDPSSPNSEVTDLVPGTSVTFEWTITNGSCPATADQMTIVVDQLPTIADAGSDRQTCDTLTNAIGNTPVTGTGLWTVVSGTATIVSPSSPTTMVTGLVHGEVTSLQWSITNGSCPPSTDQMTISVLTYPDAGPDQQLCFDDNTTTMDANPVTVGVGAWYVASGMAIIDDYFSPTTSVTLTPGIATSLVWQVWFPPEGCNINDTMMVTWANLPDGADAGLDQTLCNLTTTTLEGNEPLVGMGQWSVISGTATIIDPSAYNSDVTGLVPGTSVVLQWTITSGECMPAEDQMTIIIDALPTTADAGPDQYLCDVSNTTLEGNTPVVGTGAWSVLGGSATLTDPVSPTSGVTGLAPPFSFAFLRWRITNGACVSDDFMSIIVEEIPFVDAGVDQFLCNTTTTSLDANEPVCLEGSCEEGLWVVISGTATITDPTSHVTGLTGLVPGTSVTLEWTITNQSGYCSASDQIAITVYALPTTANAGPDQILCSATTTSLAANTPIDGDGLWTVISGAATIDDPSSPSSGVSNLVAGTSVTLEWTITNGNCPASADQMIITIDEMPTTADAGPWQYLCEEYTTSLQGNTPVSGTGLWTLVDGFATITNPLSPTSGVTGLDFPYSAAQLKWTITNGLCVSEDVTYIIVEALPIANAGPDQALCDVSSTIVSADPFVCSNGNQDCETGYWTVTDECGGSNTSVTFTEPDSPITEVNGLMPGCSYTLVWTLISESGNCSSSDEIVIIVSELPSGSDAGPDQQLCNLTETTLAGNSPMIGTGLWSVVSGTATITTPDSPTSGVTDLLPGTSVTLQWTITNENCPASTDQMTITVDDPATIADAGPDQYLCDVSTTTLAGNTPLAGTGEWTVLGGSGIITDPTSPTSGVTGLAPSFSFAFLRWRIVNGSCMSESFMSIIVDYIPTVDAGPDQYLCNTTTSTLAGNEPYCDGEGGCEDGLWSVISGTATITDPTVHTSGVTGLVPGTSVTLEWTLTNPGGYCSASDQVTIYVDELPTDANAGPDQELCNQTTTILAGNTPIIGTGLWSVISGTATITTPESPTSGVTGLVPGNSATLQWTISNGVCPASSDQMTIIVDALPTSSNAGPDQQHCNQTTATLAANTPIIGSGLWSVVSGTATITTPDSPTTGVTGLIIGTTVTLQWSITNGVCPASTDQMTITVFALPTTANAGPDQQLCNQSTTSLSANTPVNGTGLWSVISGVASISSPASPTSGITGLIPGTSATLQWTISNGVCPASSDQMTIIVDALPTTSNAGPDQQLCNQTTTTLAANTPVVGTGLWSVVSGTATITTPSSPTSGVTGLIIGTSVTLQWSITNGVCPGSTDQMTITVFALPTTANAGPDQQLCNQTATTLAANAPVVGTGLWSVVSGTANITTPGLPNSGATGLIPGTSVTLQWTISNGVCPASTDQMTIVNYALPTIANAGFDQELCNQTNTIVFGNNPIVGTGMWSVINGTANIVNPSSPVTPVNGLIPGTTVTLQWNITNGVCPSSMDQMTITTYALPTVANAGPDQQFCNQSTTTLAGNLPLNGTGLWTVFSGIANITNPTSPTSGVTGLVPGSTVLLQWTITNGTCPPSFDLMKIIIDALPGPVDAGPDQFLCDQTFTTLEAETPLIGIGSWSVIVGTADVLPIHLPHAAVINLELGTTTTLQWAVSNGTCPATTDEISITVSDAPTEADAGPDQLVCQSTSTSLQGNTPLVGEGFWLKISGPGVILDPESPSSGITGLQSNATTIVQWTIWNGDCQPSVDEMTIEVTDVVVIADAGLDQLICGENSVTLSGNDPQAGSGFWTIIEGTGTIIDPTDPTTDVIDLIPGETLVLQWRIITGDCLPSSDQVSIFTALSGFANAGADQILCATTSTTVEASIPIAGSGQWIVISGNAQVIPDDQPVAQVMNLEPGTSVVLQWTVFNDGCPPDSDLITIQVDLEPSMALAGMDQMLCHQDSAQLAANGALVGTGIWSLISGSAIIQDPLSPASMVTGLLPGTTAIFEWSISSGVCPSSKDSISVQVDALPTMSDAGPDQKFCDLMSTSLMANDPVFGQGVWTVLSGSGNVSNPDSAATILTDLQPGNDVLLLWTISNGVCQESIDTVLIQSDHLPTMADAGEAATACSDVPYALEGNVPIYGEGQWTIVSGHGSLTDPQSPVSSLIDLEADSTIILVWTISNGTCPSSTDEVILQVQQSPTPADAGTDQMYCNETQATLNANSPSIGTGQWEIISGVGMLADSLDPFSVVTALSSDTSLLLQWVTTHDGCESRDSVSIITYASPTEADAGEDQIICTNQTVLNANTALNGTGIWTIVSGTGTIADTTDANTAISDLIPGSSVILQWSIGNGICPESVDEVVLTVVSDALVAVAGEDQHLCDTTTTSMQAIPAMVGTGTWTILSGSAIIEDSLSENTMVSGLLPGSETILRWTVSANGCPPAFDDVVITIDALPLPAETGTNDSICSTTYMLSAVEPAIGIGEWTILAGVGTLQNAFDPLTLLSDLVEGTSISLEWRVSNGICPSVSDTIVITSMLPSDIPMASDDQMLCNSSTTVLKGNNPDPGMGSWTLISGAGVIEDTNDSMTQVTGLGIGVNVFAWTISNGICPPLSDTVIVINNDGAELDANFLVSEFACTGDSVYMFDISNNEVPPTGYFWDFGDNTTSTERDPIHVYAHPGEYTITFTTELEGCGTASIIKVITIFDCLSNPPENVALRNVISAKVYPNPSDADFQVSIQLREASAVEITLFDVVGRMIATRNITDQKDIMSTFTVEISGAYFFRISVGYEEMIFKVVKVE